MSTSERPSIPSGYKTLAISYGIDSDVLAEGAVEVLHCMAELVDNDAGGITSEVFNGTEESIIDKPGSMAEADERDETDELADMDRELVNSMYMQYLMAENHALAKRSQQIVMRQTSREKKNQSRWAVYQAKCLVMQNTEKKKYLQDTMVSL